jgi:hypothetical protein
MSSITLNPGAFDVVSMRVLSPYQGVWVADLELSPDILATAPSSGKVTITIGPALGPPLATLVGTIDPRGTGQFVEFYRVRVLGGGAGWDQPVTPQHYHSDGGLFAPQVFGVTAVEVGEVVATPIPISLGSDFVRTAGPASRVLDGFDWWVDPATGVTTVGTRLPAVADSTLEIVSWNPADQVAELHCETLILPGTILVDTRIPSSPVTVRDVEQTFDMHGSHAKAWCGASPEAQFMNDLRSAVVEFSGRRYLATYPYRVIVQNSDGRLELQAVNPTDGVPTTLPISPWYGTPGASAKFTPGALVRVAFFHADPSRPIVDSYEPSLLPLEATYDASAILHLGPTAPSVQLAGGTGGPLVLATPYAGLLAALATFAGAMAAAATGPLAPMNGPATALGSALGVLPPAATRKTVAA